MAEQQHTKDAKAIKVRKKRKSPKTGQDRAKSNRSPNLLLNSNQRYKPFSDYVIRELMRVSRREKNCHSLGSNILGRPSKRGPTARNAWIDFKKGTAVTTFHYAVHVLHRLRWHARRGTLINGLPHKSKQLPLLTSRQMLEALQRFTHLSPSEIKGLGLPAHSQHPLLQEAFKNLATIEGETVPDVYREVYDLSLQGKPLARKDLFSYTLASVKRYVKQRVEKADHPVAIQEQQAQVNRINHAIERLLLQAGTGQTRFLKQNNTDEVTQQSYIGDYIDADFIDQLSDTVHANNQLQGHLPVYLKRVALEPVGPFPLPKPDDAPAAGWFAETLLSIKEDVGIGSAPVDEVFTQLPSRSVMRVTVDFYIRLGDMLDGDVQRYEALQSTVGKAKRLHFQVTTTGTGGSNSIITRAINQALLADVACMRDTYYPIAHDVFVKQTNVHQRVLSSVKSHSFVQLCRNETLVKAMKAMAKRGGQQIAPYDRFAGRDIRGTATFINFDMLTSAATAAMLARLKAISDAPDIDEDTYLRDVLDRVVQQRQLQQAEALLTGYPFSSFALSGWLETQLLNNVDVDTTVVHNARLTAVETFLVEGNTTSAYRYLKVVHDALNVDAISGVIWLKRCNQTGLEEREKPTGSVTTRVFNVVSGQLMARYELCLARYLTVLDNKIAREDRKYYLDALDPDVLKNDRITRTDVVKEAWRRLVRAEQHLTVRLIKYHLIGEVSQSTSRPYYRLLAEIYLHRAILFLWYPSVVPTAGSSYEPPVQDDNISRATADHANRNRLYLLERARVYAGCDGDEVLYAICTAYQCRAWLMTAFTVGEGRLRIKKTQIGKRGTFDKGQALAWAKRLRNHALIQYAATGQRCYHATKAKSGLSIKAQPYGNCTVESLPQIRETINKDTPRYDPDKGVLDLDMGYLSIKRGWVDSDTPHSSDIIYLFGPQACHLFFIRGLYHLCSDAVEEFGEETIGEDFTLAQWDAKLEHCYRLFTYAYAVSGNGCEIWEDDDGTRHISRQFEKDDQGIENELHDDHAMSVWNLFPFKIAEITDIGCVMAAACAALRCYTADDKDARENEVKTLLGLLSGDKDGQQREYKHQFNDYLLPYVKRCRKAIVEVMEKAENETASADIVLRERKNLLKKILSLNAL